MKPMLACKDLKDYDQLEGRYPLLASPKLDGIRAITYGGELVSRRLKRLPNEHMQRRFDYLPSGLDGEVIVGDPCSPTCFNTTTSGVMSKGGEPDVTFYLFDRIDVTYGFEHRQKLIEQWHEKYAYDDVKIVHQSLIHNKDQLISFEWAMLEQGYEGVMLRSLDGKYKFGRSTLREGGLMKLKRFEDSEARILGTVELMHNNNEQTTDKLGRSKRSSHKANMEPGDTLGALSVVDIHTGVKFELGSGYTAELRKQLWIDKEDIVGKIVKYKYFPIGVKDKPRHPTFLGFRKD